VHRVKALEASQIVQDERIASLEGELAKLISMIEGMGSGEKVDTSGIMIKIARIE